MKAYSIDLRERVVRAVERGMAKSQAARTFAVSLATVKNYVRLVHQTGSLAARPIPGRPRGIPRAQDAALVAQLRATPDASLEELVVAWRASQRAVVSVATMSRAIRRVRWTRKKSSHDHLIPTADENGGRGGILSDDSVREAVGQRLVPRARKKV